MSTPTTSHPVQTITTAELARRLARPEPFELWNVLTDDYFTGRMIPGSRRVPLDRIGRELERSGLAKNAEIVTYCSGPGCPLSRQAAEKLIGFGYSNVSAYEGGLAEWTASGNPVAGLQAA
jgi:rhodanese-related sulfurtransferase